MVPPRTPGPEPGAKKVRLLDGSAVLLRPVEPADAPLLEDGFARLSARSRRSRFLAAKPRLSAAEVRYFTEVDHVDHEAIVAVGDGRGVGIARYIRDRTDPRCAELAITVVDEWQRRRLGTALLAELSCRAYANQVRQFTALVAEDNVAVVRLLRRMNADVELVAAEWGTMSYDIVLRPSARCCEPRSRGGAVLRRRRVRHWTDPSPLLGR